MSGRDLVTEQLDIVRVMLDVEFPSEAIGMYLCQIDVNLDPNTNKLIAPSLAWEEIETLFNFILSHQETQPSHFVLLPEISVPAQHVDNLYNYFVENFPLNCVLIAGIELVQANQYSSIAQSLHIDISESSIPCVRDTDFRPLNLCIVAAKHSDGQSSFYLQPKLTHSKFEGSLDAVTTLFPCNIVYYFCTDQVRFITLICSDLINRRRGSIRKIVDEVVHDLIEEKCELDFLFNIQYNRNPDHALFVRSLDRLYEDGYLSRSHLCTIFLNAILSDQYPGGRSKAMFHCDRNMPSTPLIKQIDAPVNGYELGDETPTLTFLQFERLPRSWDVDRDQHPLHIQRYKKNHASWIAQTTPPVAFLSPLEKPSVLNSLGYDDLARIESQLGHCNKACFWALKALNHWEREKQFSKATQAALLSAQQYRHQGLLNDALRMYAQGEQNIRMSPLQSPEEHLTWWRIQVGRLMVETYLLEGDTKRYLSELRRLDNVIEDYLSSHRDLADHQRDRISLYRTHTLRQIAEMYRLTGYYGKAYKAFRRTEKQYNYVYAREKAYSKLGQAETLRMTGSFEAAASLYNESKEYAIVHDDRRLLFRAMRGLAELHMCTQGDVSEFTSSALDGLAHEDHYLFGRLYYLLFIGERLLIKKQLDAARHFFRETLELSRNGNEVCQLEFTHALFGLAEANRLDKNPECVEQYRTASQHYARMGVGWGIFRTALGIALASEGNLSEGAATNAQCKKSWKYDWKLYNDILQNPNSHDRVLFLNPP